VRLVQVATDVIAAVIVCLLAHAGKREIVYEGIYTLRLIEIDLRSQ
jgi:hypothetical protein